MWGERQAVYLPLLSTACHSSFDFWTGKVIFGAGFLELKRLPRKDGVGMDFVTTAAAWAGVLWREERGALVRSLVDVDRTMKGQEGGRMRGFIGKEGRKVGLQRCGINRPMWK